MKKYLAYLSAVLLFLSLSFTVSAHLENDNPRASIAFVGPHVITGPGGSMMPGFFKVRVIDAHGAPMAGLRVWFYNNALVSIPENPPLPPANLGSFQGPEDPPGVITDANGVATSRPYRLGFGPYDVVAGIYGIAGPENAVVGFPPLVAYFHINHVPQEPLVVPSPQGTSGAVTLPTLSVPALALFALALVLLTLLHLRKLGPTGRRKS